MLSAGERKALSKVLIKWLSGTTSITTSNKNLIEKIKQIVDAGNSQRTLHHIKQIDLLFKYIEINQREVIKDNPNYPNGKIAQVYADLTESDQFYNDFRFIAAFYHITDEGKKIIDDIQLLGSKY